MEPCWTRKKSHSQIDYIAISKEMFGNAKVWRDPPLALAHSDRLPLISHLDSLKPMCVKSSVPIVPSSRGWVPNRRDQKEIAAHSHSHYSAVTDLTALQHFCTHIQRNVPHTTHRERSLLAVRAEMLHTTAGHASLTSPSSPSTLSSLRAQMRREKVMGGLRMELVRAFRALRRRRRQVALRKITEVITSAQAAPGFQITRPKASSLTPVFLALGDSKIFERDKWDELLTKFAHQKFGTGEPQDHELLSLQQLVTSEIQASNLDGVKTVSPGFYHLLSAVASGKPNKAPGIDDITRECLKLLPVIVKHRMYLLFKAALLQQFSFPDAWSQVQLGGIPKCNQPKDLSDDWRWVGKQSQIAKTFIKHLSLFLRVECSGHFGAVGHQVSFPEHPLCCIFGSRVPRPTSAATCGGVGSASGECPLSVLHHK